MAAKAEVHPDSARLNAFALGTLEPVDIDAIESHLASCETCCDALKQMKADTFVGLVRAANPRAAASAPVPAPDANPSGTVRAAPAMPVHAGLADAPTIGSAIGAGAASDSATQTERTASTAPFELSPELMQHPRYRVIELLGSGGMGAVYRAEHRLMQRSVALKVINPKLVASASAVERFRREVQAAARLQHPNIVHAYDAEQAGDVHYLVMEYVKGTDLGKVLEERGALPIAEACAYIRQAALGLQHAHENGMVHRDIKPQNLIVTSGESRGASKSVSPAPELFPTRPGAPATSHPSPMVKILDFGLASLTTEMMSAGEVGAEATSSADLQRSSLTQAGSLMGTPDYMAPEQAKDAHSADIRSDIYSLGCTLYCLLTGAVPFPGGTAIDKVLAHATNPPRPIATLRRDMPAALVKVLDKMMAKDPAQRYQTPAEVAAALEGFVRPDAARQYPSRRRSGLVAVAAGLVALLSGVIYIQTDRGQLEIDCKVDDVQVVVSKGGKEFEVIDLQSGSTVRKLPSGEYTIALKGDRTDVKLSKGGFYMSRRGAVVLTVTPTPVVAATNGMQVRRFDGHTGPVSCVAYSPDGKRAVTGSGDFFGNTDLTARIWDVHTGKVLRTLKGHHGAIRAVAFCPDGRRVLTGAWDGTVRLWDANTGTELHRFDDPNILIHGVAVSADGKWAFSGGHIPGGGKPGAMGSVRKWDLEKRSAVNGWGITPFQVWEVAVAPDDKHILLACHDGMARLWDAASGKEVRRFEGHTHFVSAAKFSPDGRRALTGSTDQTLRLWDVATGKELRRLEGHIGDASGVAFFQDGRRAVSVGADKTLRLWDLETGKQFGNAAGHIEWIFGVAVAADDHVITASFDKTARLWRIHDAPSTNASAQAAESVQRFVGHQAAALRVTLTPGGDLLASSGKDNTVRVWDTQTGKQLQAFPTKYNAVPVALSPDGNLVAAIVCPGPFPGQVIVWQVRDGKKLFEVQTISGWIGAITFSPDSRQVAWIETFDHATTDQAIRIVDARTGKEVRTIRDRKERINTWALAYRPDGQELACSALDGPINVWDPATGKHLRELKGHAQQITRLHYSPDGDKLITGSMDRTFKVLQASTGQQLWSGDAHSAGVGGVTSPDGYWHVSSLPTGTLEVRDARTGEMRATLTGHSSGIAHLYCSADGALVASASLDNTIRLWRMPAPVLTGEANNLTLAGDWQPVRVEQNGQPADAAVLKKIDFPKHFVFRGDRWGAVSPSGKRYESVYLIDLSQTPARIEVQGSLFEGMPDLHGILKQQGDTLTICVVEKKQPPPTEFATQPNTGQMLIVARRIAVVP